MNEFKGKDGTVGKALDVLDQIASFERPVRFGELLVKSTYPKPTLFRLVQTLLSQGMLEFDRDTHCYSMGLRLVKFAHAAWQQSSLAPIAKPIVDILADELDATLHVAQLDNGQVLYVDKREKGSPLSLYSMAGKVAPSYCTGIGKAMLAFLPSQSQDIALEQQSFFPFTEFTVASKSALQAELKKIKEYGHATDNQEHEANIICVAVPILTPSEQMIGGLSITASRHTTTIDDLCENLPALKAAAQKIAIAFELWQYPHRQA